MKGNVVKDAKKVVKGLRHLVASGKVYTFGNGGSAAIADHMACDWMKFADSEIPVISLSSNGPLLSAIANDMGYEQTCRYQIDQLLNSDDILVLISSSGKSSNIVKAAEKAQELGVFVIGFTGMSGGGLKELADVNVHIDSKDYGEIEDYHSNVMHMVARMLRAGK